MLGGGRLSPTKWSAGCGIDSLYLGLKIIGIEADYFNLIEKSQIERTEQWVSIGTLLRITNEVGAYGLAIKIKGRKKAELTKLLRESAHRTAILHLRACEGQPEHLACAFLSRKGEIRIAGGTTYQSNVAMTWRKRWSGAILLLSRRPFHKGNSIFKSAPRIDFDKTFLDFNEVANSSQIDYSFKIRNIGGEVLHVKKIIASCSCSKPELTDSIILPGECTTVKGNINVGTEPGTVGGSLTILSNDPKRPAVNIILKWTVGPPIVQPKPASITMSDILPGSLNSVEVKLDFRKDTAIEPNDIDIVANPDWIDCILLPDGQTLKVTMHPMWANCSSER